MDTEQNDSCWPAICLVCKQTFMSDGEPCCNDIVCQAVMNRYFEQQSAVEEAEDILQDGLDIKALVLAVL